MKILRHATFVVLLATLAAAFQSRVLAFRSLPQQPPDYASNCAGQDPTTCWFLATWAEDQDCVDDMDAEGPTLTATCNIGTYSAELGRACKDYCENYFCPYQLGVYDSYGEGGVAHCECYPCEGK
jgi:hypothetical protein